METQEREKQRALKWLNSDVIFFFSADIIFFNIHYTGWKQALCHVGGSECRFAAGHRLLRGCEMPIAASKSGFWNGYGVMVLGICWIPRSPAGRSPLPHPAGLSPSPVSWLPSQDQRYNFAFSSFKGWDSGELLPGTQLVVDNLSQRHQIDWAHWHFPAGMVSDKEGCAPRTPLMTF